MKRSLSFAIVAAISALPLLVMAAEVRFGEHPSIATNEHITKNTYVGGGNVSSAGAITGDLVVFGGNVLITGTVSQDLIVAGGSVSSMGAVGNSVRAAGGNIVINGKIKGDIAAAGGQITVSGDGAGGDVLAAGGSIRIEAPVGGDVRVRGGQLFIDAPVRGNVDYKGGQLHLGSNAAIHGNLTYTARSEAKVESGARVDGSTNYTPASPNGAAAIAFSFGILAKFLVTLACALIFGLVFRRLALTIIHGIAEKPLLEIGRGFAVIVLLPVASVLLLFTVLGAPIGVLGLFAFAAYLVFSAIVSPVLLGSLVHRWTSKHPYDVTWLSILTGSILYSILSIIPILGFIAKVVLCLAIIGATAKIKWEAIKEWR